LIRGSPSASNATPTSRPRVCFLVEEGVGKGLGLARGLAAHKVRKRNLIALVAMASNETSITVSC